jgi:predicted amidohydrolase YtcJ
MTRATRLFINGPVLTLDEFGTTAEALALDGEKILAVGSERAVSALAGPGTMVTDLGGRTVLPAFIDGHGHFMETGRYFTLKLDLRPPPLGTTGSIEDIKIKVAERAAGTPPGGWIEGFGYDDTLLADGRHPLAEDLDQAAPDHPVALSHVSGHFLAVNSKALALAGLGAGAEDPKGGRLRRRPDGSPNGLLEEPPAENLVRRVIPKPSAEEERRAAVEASAMWAAKGVGTAQDGWTSAANLAALEAAAAAGDLGVRVQILPDRALALSGAVPIKSGTPLGEGFRLVSGPAKLFADGSLQGYTGHLSNPYHRVMYDLGPLWRGYPMTDPAELADQVAELHRLGRQVAIHANGDRAIEDVIDAFEAALKVRPVSDHRHFIIHCQTVREDQLDRMAELGVQASFFAVHVHWWGDRHHDVFLGPDRANRIDPLASAAGRGIVFSLHNDSPITGIAPLLSVSVAMSRATSGGRILGPEYRLPALAALRAVTADAARLAFEERRKGRIAPGLLADLAVLSANPLKSEPEEVAAIKVLATLVGGKIVHGEL